MGNCQAIDTATLVIQHPSGKSDKLYWPVCASEIMKMNPGHYVALLISTTICPSSSSSSSAGSNPSSAPTATGDRPPAAGNLRVTRIKLLRPTDTLVLGQVYRLITAQEVMKVLSAKKCAKMKKLGQQESVEKVMGSDMKLDNLLVGKHERQRNQKTTSSSSSSNSGTPRPRTWQPSLHSISEAAS
ncbi:uncharacterized protein LOC116215565 [Punica granatum]|uniref:DUF4228 domain-containing protein n=2 Tax=Punica granatum TaxID=22663 RepID=A0A218VY85_PUNGR|nr:uncharacterized protein LOC116215565 [Punica granatum]OWM65376.1 hypothetical protein CDL15_Pgr008966 [Punica granatum]PKI34922.1 hypothetical protein CRG98_044702 [Punica granatum]